MKYDLAYIKVHFPCIIENAKKIQFITCKLVKQVENSVKELPLSANMLYNNYNYNKISKCFR